MRDIQIFTKFHRLWAQLSGKLSLDLLEIGFNRVIRIDHNHRQGNLVKSGAIRALTDRALDLNAVYCGRLDKKDLPLLKR